jgi:hypothetical protein
MPHSFFHNHASVDNTLRRSQWIGESVKPKVFVHILPYAHCRPCAFPAEAGESTRDNRNFQRVQKICLEIAAYLVDRDAA